MLANLASQGGLRALAPAAAASAPAALQLVRHFAAEPAKEAAPAADGTITQVRCQTLAVGPAKALPRGRWLVGDD